VKFTVLALLGCMPHAQFTFAVLPPDTAVGDTATVNVITG